MNQVFRVAFLGRGELGMRVLTGLLEMPHVHVPIIVSCRTSPELDVEPEAFAQLAARHGIPYHFTNDLNSSQYENLLSSLELDLGVAMLWVNTIGGQVIKSCGRGVINLHGGELPRYRGNACQSWAIINREPTIGVTCHLMQGDKLDSGPILLRDRIPVDENTTVGEAITAVTEIGTRLVLDAVTGLLSGDIEPIPQVEDHALYCYPRLPRDGEINWRDAGATILDLIRAANHPYPGAYSWFRDALAPGQMHKLQIWRARILDSPGHNFLGVPGHVIAIEEGLSRGVITGDMKVLTLDEISLDGHNQPARDVFRSVRQRLGLDLGAELASMRSRLERLESRWELGAHESALVRFADWFCTEGYDNVRRLEGEVEQVIDECQRQLSDDGVSVRLNPLRNYSFQHRHFQWEMKEVTFGIQIYRSLEVEAVGLEGVSFGYWLFSDEEVGLTRRIYAGIPDSLSVGQKIRVCGAFHHCFPDGPVASSRDDKGEFQGVFALTNQVPYLATATSMAEAIRCVISNVQ